MNLSRITTIFNQTFFGKGTCFFLGCFVAGTVTVVWRGQTTINAALSVSDTELVQISKLNNVASLSSFYALLGLLLALTGLSVIRNQVKDGTIYTLLTRAQRAEVYLASALAVLALLAANYIFAGVVSAGLAFYYDILLPSSFYVAVFYDFNRKVLIAALALFVSSVCNLKRPFWWFVSFLVLGNFLAVRSTLAADSLLDHLLSVLRHLYPAMINEDLVQLSLTASQLTENIPIVLSVCAENAVYALALVLLGYCGFRRRNLVHE